jgi:predicted ATPase
MGYSYTDIDTTNMNWFRNDKTRSSLKAIRLTHGKIRGLGTINIEFTYPISAIAGRNGVGKSTILRMAACAYKNKKYKFGNSFVQVRDEEKLEDVEVEYEILTDTPAPTKYMLRRGPNNPSFQGYNMRLDRNVDFISISRIVALSEDYDAKSKRFKDDNDIKPDWGDDVRKLGTKILEKDYRDLFRRGPYLVTIHSDRSGLQGNLYSEFNMGAGESSVFNVLSSLIKAPENSLILIEEIEIGLHERAQSRLIEELKDLCYKRKFQIICTTHSSRILEALPPEGRIFLERVGESTSVIPGISSAYASGKLTGESISELDILVEDDIAKSIVENCLTSEQRKRVKIMPIGSSAAVMRHLAARYKDKENRQNEVCVILDGDKSSSKIQQINTFLKGLERSMNRESETKWVEKRLNFLPGTTWPESWLINQNHNRFFEKLSEEWGINIDKVYEIISAAKIAGKKGEFHEIAKQLNLDENIVIHQCIKAAFEVNPSEQDHIKDFIQGFLR